VDPVITELENAVEAEESDAAAFAAARTAARGQPVTTKEGEVADAGGGNRRAPRKGRKTDAAGAPVDAVATGDALLA
jgi:hypothetical protein